MCKVSRCRNCYCARIVLLAITLGTVVGARIARGEQNQPALQLTSPADGTVVAPGQPLSLTVVAISNARFVEVSVISPLGGSSIANSLPAQLSMTVPADVALQKYGLTATGGTSDGQVLYSNQVTIDVERPDLPTSLRAEPDSIFFSGQSGDEPLTVYGIFSDGTQPEVTGSTNLSFASSDPAIATVDVNGVVKPVSQGSATITATYTLGSRTVRVSIPVTVPKPTAAQSKSPAQLRITSPLDNTVVAPGQSISITVISPSNTPFTEVAVVGQGPLGMTDSTDVLPAQFSLAIPQQINLQRYSITAEGGVTGNGTPISSNVVHIDVERPGFTNTSKQRPKGHSFCDSGRRGAAFDPSDILGRRLRGRHQIL